MAPSNRMLHSAKLARSDLAAWPLTVTLAGTSWEGTGLDATTVNGPVNLRIPRDYNAQLETRTVNGGVRFDYPMTVVGELTARHGINATLGPTRSATDDELLALLEGRLDRALAGGTTTIEVKSGYDLTVAS